MVKKMIKYAKFVVSVALILSLVAPSYAALSASDGSAFVTKAEFDSALADFNARLTTFEAGINSKIDSQVTSYLDRNGIWSGKEVVLLSYDSSNGYALSEVMKHEDGCQNVFYLTKGQDNKVRFPGNSQYGYDYFDMTAKLPKSGLLSCNISLGVEDMDKTKDGGYRQCKIDVGLADKETPSYEWTYQLGFQIQIVPSGADPLYGEGCILNQVLWSETGYTTNLGDPKSTGVWYAKQNIRTSPTLVDTFCLGFCSTTDVLRILSYGGVVNKNSKWDFRNTQTSAYTWESRLKIKNLKIY